MEAEVAHEVDELVGGAEGVVEEARVLVLEDPGESFLFVLRNAG